jgi:hypothetical protein
MLNARETRCPITPNERHDRFRHRFTQWQRNAEEPNDKPRKGTSIHTRSVNLLGAS